MLGRGFRTFVFAYLMLGVVSTVVTETISAMQGSSRVLGLASSGGSAEAITLAVAQDWLIPIVTWPVSVASLAYRELSAR